MGIMPVSECRRRKKKECPCPARSGATPARIVTGVVVLGTDAATTLPCRSGDDPRTHHYLGRQEKKSRRARATDAEDCFSTAPEARRIRCFHKLSGSP